MAIALLLPTQYREVRVLTFRRVFLVPSLIPVNQLFSAPIRFLRLPATGEFDQFLASKGELNLLYSAFSCFVSDDATQRLFQTLRRPHQTEALKIHQFRLLQSASPLLHQLRVLLTRVQADLSFLGQADICFRVRCQPGSCRVPHAPCRINYSRCV